MFEYGENISEQFLLEVKKDERKGVQKVYERWKNSKDKQALLEAQFEEMLQYERKVRSNGVAYIAGIDEVGRVI